MHWKCEGEKAHRHLFSWEIICNQISRHSGSQSRAFSSWSLCLDKVKCSLQNGTDTDTVVILQMGQDLVYASFQSPWTHTSAPCHFQKVLRDLRSSNCYGSALFLKGGGGEQQQRIFFKRDIETLLHDRGLDMFKQWSSSVFVSIDGYDTLSPKQNKMKKTHFLFWRVTTLTTDFYEGRSL